MKRLFAWIALLALTATADAQPIYDLLLRGGHVIDARNHVDAVMDVAIKNGHVARVAPNLKSGDAAKTIDVRGLLVMPGLIDLHVHVYNGTGEKDSYAGDLSVPL
jgi:dihydroorotase